MDSIKIGVIAGTPIDTRMGEDFVIQKGHEAVGIPTASCPEEQNLLQYMHPDILTEKIMSAVKSFETRGITRTMIYCNSLSSAVDMEYLRAQNPNSVIVTPLDIYKSLAIRLSSIMLWAANAQCLASIEKIFYDKNPALEIIGTSMLPVVKAIEEQEVPASIAERFNLRDLCRWAPDCQALVLGCTHFPYLLSELVKYTEMTIIDPGDEMLKTLIC